MTTLCFVTAVEPTTPPVAHLFCEDLDALHAFAKQIGVSRSAFRPALGALPACYLLSASRHEVAIVRGAIELNWTDTFERFRYRRTRPTEASK